MGRVSAKKSGGGLSVYLSICAISAAFLSFVFRPSFHGNETAANVLVTIFSVLAGFMIAVIAIAADGAILRRKDWRQDAFYLSEARKQLTRYRLMFHIYLIVPALVFLAQLELSWYPGTQAAVEYLLLFLAAFALLWSFSLPGEMTQAYVRKLKQAIDDQRQQEYQDLIKKD